MTEEAELMATGKDNLFGGNPVEDCEENDNDNENGIKNLNIKKLKLTKNTVYLVIIVFLVMLILLVVLRKNEKI